MRRNVPRTIGPHTAVKMQENETEMETTSLLFFFLRMFTRSARLTYFLPFAAESFLAVFAVLERTLPASVLI